MITILFVGNSLGTCTEVPSFLTHLKAASFCSNWARSSVLPCRDGREDKVMISHRGSSDRTDTVSQEVCQSSWLPRTGAATTHHRHMSSPLLLLLLTSVGCMILRHEAHMPAPAFTDPNTFSGRSSDRKASAASAAASCSSSLAIWTISCTGRVGREGKG